MKKTHYISFILICSFCWNLIFTSSHSNLLSNQEFITGEDGVIRMYVNILGNVKNPGTYLVYDKVDFMSAISLAGGYLSGSNLSDIIVYHKDGTSKKINFKKNISSNIPISEFLDLKPHDTIYIKEKFLSKVFNSSNLPYVMLGILNIVLTLQQDD